MITYSCWKDTQPEKRLQGRQLRTHKFPGAWGVRQSEQSKKGPPDVSEVSSWNGLPEERPTASWARELPQGEESWEGQSLY